MFEFKPRKTGLDARSEFANYACDLLVAKHRKDIRETIKDVTELYKHFQIHVRNVYELTWTEIPLFGLYELMKHGKDNYGFNEDEYEEAKLKTLKACNQYHSFDMHSIIEWEKANLK